MARPSTPPIPGSATSSTAPAPSPCGCSSPTTRATNLIPARLGGGSGRTAIYVRDRTTGWVALVSVAFDGSDPIGNADAARISEDGRTIVFLSGADNHVPNDDNGRNDVFRVENPLWEPPSP